MGTPTPCAVIVGVGRSGTGYIAALLNAVGIDCGHEEHWTADPERHRPVPVDAS